MNTIKKRALTSIAVCFMACLMFSMPVLAASNSFSKTTVKLPILSVKIPKEIGIFKLKI